MDKDTTDVVLRPELIQVGKEERGTVVLGERHVMVEEQDGWHTHFLSTNKLPDVLALSEDRACDITALARINDIRHLNTFFGAINLKLPVGGFYTGCVETCEQQKQRFFKTYPRWAAWPCYVVLFLLKRVAPKLTLTRGLYFALTAGRNRALSKAEVLGRLIFCGFEIVDYREIGDELYFVVQKTKAPEINERPSYGPIFKMERVGRGGHLITVYKLRTMHPYAQYLQAHIHAKHNLQENGKFNDDFRITTWGQFLRKSWLDEVPMLINWLKGDIKLVGVRPLSRQYLSLYPQDMVDRREAHKPGLIPPYYVDLPKKFDEIVASEQRYLEAYETHPFKTDVRYFFAALYNIFIGGARSQ